MTPVRIYDRLRWSPPPAHAAARFSLDYDAATSPDLRDAAPANSENLVWQAFELIARTAGVEPTGHVTLEKRIPVQAGMGGASSDAAAALVLANAAWGLDYPHSRLAELAAQLGSDVPFFLADGPAICRGRGERVEPIVGLPQLHLVVVKPPAGVSTAAAFGSLQAGPATAAAARDSQARLGDLVDNLRRGALARAARGMVNRLEDAAVGLYPVIARLRDAFAHAACLGQLMTGSGSAYFGVMRSARQAQRVARQLSAQLKTLANFDDEHQRTRNLRSVFATATCHAASPPL